MSKNHLKYCPVIKTTVRKSDSCELFEPVEELILIDALKVCINCKYRGKKYEDVPEFMR